MMDTNKINNSKLSLKAVFIVTWLLLVSCFAQSAEQSVWYLGYRIPSTDRPWVAADYAKMLETLKAISQEKPDMLPRRGGEFTGDLYDRMVSQENFRPQLSIYSSAVMRREEAFSILQYLQEIMKVYFDFKAKKQVYGAEALGLMAYSIRQQAVLFTVTVEFWMSLSPNDQNNPARIQGLLSSKEAAASLAISALDYLKLSNQFDTNHLIVYAYEISDSIGDLYVHLRSDDRVIIKKKVLELSRTHELEDVRKALDRLYKILTAFPEKL